MIKVETQKLGRVSQGDVLKNIEHIENVVINDKEVEITKVAFPLVIVLTQDCDLEQDYRFRSNQDGQSTQDKYLLSVLVAPIYNADQVFSGSHLSEIGLTMNPINKSRTPGKNLIQNETPRYHYLQFPDEVEAVPSVIDFKHYFSLNVEYLRAVKETNFLCQLSALYREDVSQRFSAFLSRIGLP